jgi:hypothetical protein
MKARSACPAAEGCPQFGQFKIVHPWGPAPPILGDNRGQSVTSTSNRPSRAGLVTNYS